MKSLPVIVISLLFSGAAIAQIPFQRQASQPQGDAVAVDPAHHQIVLDNEYVRVFEMRSSPGRSSPMHTHPPTLLVSLDRARFHQTLADGSREIFDMHPGQVIWLDGFQHSWELLSGDGHIIGGEMKVSQSGDRVGRLTRPDTDAVTVDPVHHHVVVENDHVRVLQAMAAPGATSVMHTHPPFLLVSHGNARLNMNTGDETVIFDLAPGQVVWLEDARHSWELLSGELEVTAVEVKAAVGQSQ